MLKEIGQILRETRERRGLSLADVQTDTHIRSRYLEAMESGAFEVIPGEVYARGFLRTYARFLNLDEMELLRRYQEGWEAAELRATLTPASVVSPSQIAPKTRRDQDGPSFRPQRQNRMLRPVILLVAIIGAVVVGLYYLGSDLGLPVNVPSGDAIVADDPPPTAATPPQVELPPEPIVHREVALQATESARPNYVLFAADLPADEPIRMAIRSGPACWWRATVDGEIVGEGTLAAGQQLEWEAKSIISVHLGNPQDITVTFAGEFEHKIEAVQPRHIVVERQPNS